MIGKVLARPESYLGQLREVVGTGICVALYPLGFVERLGDEPGRGTHTPVLLVHGFAHNRSGWLVLQRHLQNAGITRVYTMNYNPLTHDVPELAAEVAARVDAILAETGVERVHLVGHSLGGIIIRWYVQILGGDRHVATATTISTPHRGTRVAVLVPGRTATQLRPGSWVMRRLHDSAAPSAVRWISYYSNIDLLVQPCASARLDEPALAATNILVKDQGHLSILLSAALGHSLAQQLSPDVLTLRLRSPLPDVELGDVVTIGEARQ